MNPHVNISATLNSAAPVVVDASNMDDGMTVCVTAGGGTDVVLCQFTCTPNVSSLPPAQAPNVNWFPCVATGLTAGSTAAGASVSFTVPFIVTAYRFTRTAGTGTDTIEIAS